MYGSVYFKVLNVPPRKNWPAAGKCVCMKLINCTFSAPQVKILLFGSCCIDFVNKNHDFRDDFHIFSEEHFSPDLTYRQKKRCIVILFFQVVKLV